MSYAISPFDDAKNFDIEHPDTMEAYHIELGMIVTPYSPSGKVLKKYKKALFRFMVKYTIGSDPKEYTGTYYYDTDNTVYKDEQFQKLNKDGKDLFVQLPGLGPAYRPVVVSNGKLLKNEEQKEKVRDVPLPIKYAMYLFVNEN